MGDHEALVMHRLLEDTATTMMVNFRSPRDSGSIRKRSQARPSTGSRHAPGTSTSRPTLGYVKAVGDLQGKLGAPLRSPSLRPTRSSHGTRDGARPSDRASRSGTKEFDRGREHDEFLDNRVAPFKTCAHRVLERSCRGRDE